MAYVVKQKRIARKDFRNEFPQLCETKTVSEPLNFSIIKDIVEEAIVVKETVPHGWVKLNDPSTYLNRTFLRRPSPHEKMCVAVQQMRERWEKWNLEHNIEYDYDKYNDEFDDWGNEEESSDESSLEAEDFEYDTE